MADIYTMGIDLGSTTCKGVVLRNGTTVVGSSIVPSGMGTSGPEKAYEEALADAGVKREDLSIIVSTGYGRNRFEQADLVISELIAHAIGVHSMYPEARTLIDVGGHDAKAMSISERGRLENFVMNDRCAAGTGRLLEIMAKQFGVDVSEVKDLAEKAEGIVPINASCAVFAESEVIEQISKGADIPSLAKGVCASLASRIAQLVKKLGGNGPIYMSGGVGHNTGVVKALEKELGMPVTVSVIQQLNGAYGAALYGYNRVNK